MCGDQRTDNLWEFVFLSNILVLGMKRRLSGMAASILLAEPSGQPHLLILLILNLHPFLIHNGLGSMK